MSRKRTEIIIPDGEKVSGFLQSTTGPAVPGPGSLETITVRSTRAIAAGQPSDYLRLRVVLNPPP
jgi:hypothetical protein